MHRSALTEQNQTKKQGGKIWQTSSLRWTLCAFILYSNLFAKWFLKIIFLWCFFTENSLHWWLRASSVWSSSQGMTFPPPPLPAALCVWEMREGKLCTTEHLEALLSVAFCNSSPLYHYLRSTRKSCDGAGVLAFPISVCGCGSVLCFASGWVSVPVLWHWGVHCYERLKSMSIFWLTASSFCSFCFKQYSEIWTMGLILFVIGTREVVLLFSVRYSFLMSMVFLPGTSLWIVNLLWSRDCFCPSLCLITNNETIWLGISKCSDTTVLE